MSRQKKPPQTELEWDRFSRLKRRIEEVGGSSPSERANQISGEFFLRTTGFRMHRLKPTQSLRVPFREALRLQS
jgi:hypothetical protein